MPNRDDRRTELLARLFARDAHDPVSTRRRRTWAVFVGWLVLMTVWGFGRAGWPTYVPVFLVVGLAGGAATAYVLGWYRGDDGPADGLRDRADRSP